jgi:hypothetical protein
MLFTKSAVLAALPLLFVLRYNSRCYRGFGGTCAVLGILFTATCERVTVLPAPHSALSHMSGTPLQSPQLYACLCCHIHAAACTRCTEFAPRVPCWASLSHPQDIAIGHVLRTASQECVTVLPVPHAALSHMNDTSLQSPKLYICQSSLTHTAARMCCTVFPPQ